MSFAAVSAGLLIMVGCSKGVSSGATAALERPPLCKAWVYDSQWIGPGAPGTRIYRVQVEAQTLEMTGLRNPRVKLTLRYKHDPKVFTKEITVSEFYAHTSFTKDVLINGFPVHLANLEVEVPEKYWRNDSFAEAEIIAADPIDLDKADLHDATNWQAYCLLKPWVDTLAKLSADPSLKSVVNHNEADALFFALAKGDTDMVEALEKGGFDLKRTTSKGANALLYAALSHNDKIVSYVLSRGIHSVVTKSGRIPAHNAVAASNLASILALTKAKEPVDKPDNRQVTPLMMAIEAVQPEIVDALVKGGANLKHVTPNGFNLVMYALALHNSKAFDLVLKYNKDINFQNPITGDTPLHIAVAHGAREQIKTLLRMGVRRDIRNKQGLTAEDELAQNQFPADRLPMEEIFRSGGK